MITEWQLEPMPAVVPDEATDRPAVLAQLLDEIEREEAERPKPAPPRQLTVDPSPRPFAFD
jgi:hypothetical protein